MIVELADEMLEELSSEYELSFEAEGDADEKAEEEADALFKASEAEAVLLPEADESKLELLAVTDSVTAGGGT